MAKIKLKLGDYSIELDKDTIFKQLESGNIELPTENYVIKSLEDNDTYLKNIKKEFGFEERDQSVMILMKHVVIFLMMVIQS